MANYKELVKKVHNEVDNTVPVETTTHIDVMWYENYEKACADVLNRPILEISDILNQFIDEYNDGWLLNDLNDVTISTALQNHILLSDATGQWANTLLVLNTCDNVTANNTTNAVLQFNGSDWVDKILGLNDLSDVNTDGGSSGMVLTLSGSTWIPQSLPAPPVPPNSLDDLITGNNDGDILSWNATSSAWDAIAAADLGGGIGTVTVLSDLTDVSDSVPVGGQVLTYNTDTNIWEPQTIDTSGSGLPGIVTEDLGKVLTVVDNGASGYGPSWETPATGGTSSTNGLYFKRNSINESIGTILASPSSLQVVTNRSETLTFTENYVLTCLGEVSFVHTTSFSADTYIHLALILYNVGGGDTVHYQSNAFLKYAYSTNIYTYQITNITNVPPGSYEYEIILQSNAAQAGKITEGSFSISYAPKLN